MTRVYIEWHDAFSFDPWADEETATAYCNEPMLVQSTGWLLDETDKHITICHSHNKDSQVTGCIHIPIGCITKMKKYG